MSSMHSLYGLVHPCSFRDLQCCSVLMIKNAANTLSDNEQSNFKFLLLLLDLAQGHVTQHISELAQKSQRCPLQKILAV